MSPVTSGGSQDEWCGKGVRGGEKGKLSPVGQFCPEVTGTKKLLGGGKGGNKEKQDGGGEAEWVGDRNTNLWIPLLTSYHSHSLL